jgi:hypothetical protein
MGFAARGLNPVDLAVGQLCQLRWHTKKGNSALVDNATDEQL